MPYTVWSRGRLIGASDLEFPPITPRSRMGWFRPAPGAEALMEDIALPSREVLAHMLGGSAEGEDPEAVRETMRADYAESDQRQTAFALQLRDDDDRVIATSHVMIQDTLRLRELARMDEMTPCSESELEDIRSMLELPVEGLVQEIDHELGVPTAWWDEISGDDDACCWTTGDDEPVPGERYQLIALLEEPGEEGGASG